MAAKDLYEKDYYAILGVDKKADGATIKKKYRQLARELHPDKTKGDKKLEDRFKEVSEAYDILSDDKKRAEYDQAREMFKSGAFRQGANQFSGDFSDLFNGGGDIFSQIFGGRRGPRKGADVQASITISFRDSIFGKEVDIKPNLTVRIPAGISDGGKVRVKGRGESGEAGPGDLYVIVNVVPHPVFSRKGENIHLTVPVTFTEAALGADIPVPTLEGDQVKLRIAPGTANGKTFRVKGRGVKKGVNAGDLMVSIEVQVPHYLNEQLRQVLLELASLEDKFDIRAIVKAQSKT
jgi:molecular chaperone DnaJ